MAKALAWQPQISQNSLHLCQKWDGASFMVNTETIEGVPVHKEGYILLPFSFAIKYIVWRKIMESTWIYRSPLSFPSLSPCRPPILFQTDNKFKNVVVPVLTHFNKSVTYHKSSMVKSGGLSGKSYRGNNASCRWLPMSYICLKIPTLFVNIVSKEKNAACFSEQILISKNGWGSPIRTICTLGGGFLSSLSRCTGSLSPAFERVGSFVMTTNCLNSIR